MYLAEDLISNIKYMSTKVWKGNQHIATWEIDGKKYTKRQLFMKKVVGITKRILATSAITLGVAWVAVGALHIGMTQAKTVEVEKEVIKQVMIKWSDIPMLVRICKAESGLTQFEKNGDVFRGRIDKSDIGKCQINERYNNDEARRLGYDIYTEKGNEEFAVYLFLNRGTQPWLASMCIEGGWGTSVECKAQGK